MMPYPELRFATPRKLPRAKELRGRVVVLDIAFASSAGGSKGFDKITKPFIDGLGSRLAMWVDHHDADQHADYRDDPRFLLRTKAEHGACPELVTPELVAQVGPADTIVCHTDFDGLASAAKWILEGEEPYPGCDDDARAIDTRIGSPSTTGRRFDRAIRARPKDHALLGLIVRHLVGHLKDTSLWKPIDEAAAQIALLEAAARDLAARYRIEGDLAVVEVPASPPAYDKTALLLLGQQRAKVSVVLDGDTVSFAAPFDSGVNFLRLLDLSGGMPTRVSTRRSEARSALVRLGASENFLTQFNI